MKWVISLFVIFSATLALATPASASSLRGLTISPVRSEMTVAAGTVYSNSLDISNDSDQPLAVDMYAQVFSVAPETYEYTFHEDSPLNQWVHFSPATFTLQPHKSQTVDYTIGVPANATPGGKYFSLFAATNGAANRQGIDTSQRVGSLAFLTVPGDSSHKGTLLGLSTPIITVNDISWSEKVLNSGANYFKSDYTVKLKNLWGGTLSEKSGTALIVSSSVRLVEGTLAHPTWIGLYKVEATFSLGDNGSATDSRYIIYVPIARTLTILVIVSILFFFIRSERRRKQTPKANTKKKG